MSNKFFKTYISVCMVILIAGCGAFLFVNRNYIFNKAEENEDTEEVTTIEPEETTTVQEETTKANTKATGESKTKTTTSKITTTIKTTSVRTEKDQEMTAEVITTQATTSPTTLAVSTTKTSTTVKPTTTTTTTAKKDLSASVSIGRSYMCTSSGCGTYTSVTIKASGGTSPYKYSGKFYRNNSLIDTIDDSETYFTYASGTYKIEYTVTDSDGKVVSGTKTVTMS